jgi:glycosyl-4,4'-diaponeurosporenoate acyltransferase
LYHLQNKEADFLAYIVKKFWWFVILAVLSVGGSIYAVLTHCPIVWVYTLAADYLRFAVTVIGIGLATHFVGEALPRRWFHYDKGIFPAAKWEKKGKFYEEKLRISRWKDAMPDKSQAVASSVRKSVGTDSSIDHLKALLAETCVAEAVHWGLLILSPVMLFTMKSGLRWAGFGIYAFSNLPLIVIQRYNRPRLVTLLTLEQRKEARRRKEHP